MILDIRRKQRITPKKSISTAIKTSKARFRSWSIWSRFRSPLWGHGSPLRSTYC